MHQAIVHTSQVVRQVVLGQVQAAAEEQLDRQPEGFANTIRWNIGHIVYWRDRYAALCFGVPSAIPDHYAALFDSGTKPADWTEAPRPRRSCWSSWPPSSADCRRSRRRNGRRS